MALDLHAPGPLDSVRAESVSQDHMVVSGGRRYEAPERALLAGAIRAQSYAVSRAMLARAVRRPEINVGLELIALSFTERFADAVARDDWSVLLCWVDETRIRYGSMTAVARLLCTGVTAIANVAAQHGISFEDRGPAIARLAHKVEAIVARPRTAPELVASDTLDEVDVVTGELIERLHTADPATAEHSRAVAQWCARIGKRMALSAADTTFVTRCGLIHDIGKMMTPPGILQAPRRLSSSETNVMRRHAEAGGAIIGAVPLIAHHKPAVRWHHERLDGRGYPDRLSARAIPLAARIVSVADSFNAMIGNRPYRLPMRPTSALEELRRHAGTQFDPDVIAAMDDVVTKRP